MPTLPPTAVHLAALYGRLLAVESPSAAMVGKVFEQRFPGLELCVKGDGPYKFSSTQINLADAGYSRTQGPLEPKVQALLDRIDDADLADDGKEAESHITVKYGLHTSDAEEVQRIVEAFGPVVFRLGKTSVFAANKNDSQRGGDVYDVVKIDIISPDLRRLNTLLCQLEHTDTHPNYVPHCTLAYVKPGLGAKYAGLTDVEGLEGNATEIVFSNQEGDKTTIRLTAMPQFKALSLLRNESALTRKRLTASSRVRALFGAKGLVWEGKAVEDEHGHLHADDSGQFTAGGESSSDSEEDSLDEEDEEDEDEETYEDEPTPEQEAMEEVDMIRDAASSTEELGQLDKLLDDWDTSWSEHFGGQPDTEDEEGHILYQGHNPSLIGARLQQRVIAAESVVAMSEEYANDLNEQVSGLLTNQEDFDRAFIANQEEVSSNEQQIKDSAQAAYEANKNLKGDLTEDRRRAISLELEQHMYAMHMAMYNLGQTAGLSKLVAVALAGLPSSPSGDSDSKSASSSKKTPEPSPRVRALFGAKGLVWEGKAVEDEHGHLHADEDAKHFRPRTKCLPSARARELISNKSAKQSD